MNNKQFVKHWKFNSKRPFGKERPYDTAEGTYESLVKGEEDDINQLLRVKVVQEKDNYLSCTDLAGKGLSFPIAKPLMFRVDQYDDRTIDEIYYEVIEGTVNKRTATDNSNDPETEPEDDAESESQIITPSYKEGSIIVAAITYPVIEKENDSNEYEWQRLSDDDGNKIYYEDINNLGRSWAVKLYLEEERTD